MVQIMKKKIAIGMIMICMLMLMPGCGGDNDEPILPGQTKATDASAESISQTGRIKITVLEKDTEQPIQGVRIVVTGTNGFMISMTTDEIGVAQLGLSEDKYILNVNAPQDYSVDGKIPEMEVVSNNTSEAVIYLISKK